MRDNWDNDDNGWRANIMEGPHGGGRPFHDLCNEWDWRERIIFIFIMSGVAGFFALMGWLLWKIN